MSRQDRFTESRYMPTDGSLAYGRLRARRARLRRQLDDPYTPRLSKGIFHCNFNDLEYQERLDIAYLGSVLYALAGSELGANLSYISDELAAGAFALTGDELAAFISYIEDLGAGSFTFTGASMTTLNGYTAALFAGEYSWTTSELDVYTTLISEELSRGDFAWVVADLDVTRTFGDLDAAAWSYALTGGDLSVTGQFIETLNAGAFIHTGSSLDTVFGGAIRGLTGGVDTRVLAGDEAGNDRIVGYA